MLGRKDYTPEELASCRSAIDEELATYKRLAAAVDGNGAATALDEFERPFFNNLVLVLDRYFVHRIRSVSGKDGNPVNEVELLADSLMNNGGVFRGNNVIKYRAGESVLKLEPGDPIRLSRGEFERLADAYLGEIERRFVTA
jgi:hypothetical protein